MEGNRQREGPQDARCSDLGVVCSSEYFADWKQPAMDNCHSLTRNGYPVPDPRCTPGGVDPTRDIAGVKQSGVVDALRPKLRDERGAETRDVRVVWTRAAEV